MDESSAAIKANKFLTNPTTKVRTLKGDLKFLRR